jgi:hypothetical protein
MQDHPTDYHGYVPNSYDENAAPPDVPAPRREEPSINDALVEFQRMTDDQQEAFIERLQEWQRTHVAPALW